MPDIPNIGGTGCPGHGLKCERRRGDKRQRDLPQRRTTAQTRLKGSNLFKKILASHTPALSDQSPSSKKSCSQARDRLTDASNGMINIQTYSLQQPPPTVSGASTPPKRPNFDHKSRVTSRGPNIQFSHNLPLHLHL